jgi:hypothetical protein
MSRLQTVLAAATATLLVAFCLPGVGASATAWGVDGVTVKRSNGEECRSVGSFELPVKGGCVMRGHGRSEIKLITPLGLIPAAFCDGFDLRLVVDGSGKLWIDDVYLSNGLPCGDIRSCDVPETSVDVPWLGELRTAENGNVYALMRVCFDTCFGHFEGRMRVELKRDGRAWRLRADEAQVGSTAFELDGEWELRGSRGLKITRSPRGF